LELDGRRENVGALYTGEWDIEIKRWHEERLPKLDKIFIHNEIIDNISHENYLYIDAVRSILKNGPISLNFRELFAASYEHVLPFHRRRYNRKVTYDELLNKLLALHKILEGVPPTLYPDALVLPEKVGWIRKYISYYFYCKNLPLLGFMGLRFDQKYSIELTWAGRLIYLDINGDSLFARQLPSDVDQADIQSYRNSENSDQKRAGKLTFIRYIYAHLARMPSVTYSFCAAAYQLFKKKRWTTKYNESMNNFRSILDFYLMFWLGFLWYMVDALRYLLWPKFEAKKISKSDFIIIPLHHYPETSTVGEYSYVQTEIQYIDEVLSIFDTTKNIVIVEHPTTFFYGERARWIKKYFRLTRGILYFDLLATTGIPFDLIKRSKAVVTIVGGMALEKALMGGRSYISVLHPMLFVKNIQLLPTAKNKLLKLLLRMEDVTLSAHQYCALVQKYGVKQEDLVSIVLNENFLENGKENAKKL